MNTSNKKNKSGAHQIKGNEKSRGHETIVKQVQAGQHLGYRSVQIKGRDYLRTSPTGRFDESLPVSYDSKGKPEGYIIRFDEYEDLRDRIDALEAHERIKRGGGIPHEVVKLELSGLSPLAAWRKYRGLTQKSLADAANITQPYIAAMESGQKDGTTATIRQLAEVLGTTIDNLID